MSPTAAKTSSGPEAAPRALTGVHFMVGDHACAEGALCAGLDFFAGYPITPSTEIAERLSHRLPRVGGKFLQMEDELASISAIIGGSCAGARVLTATSGPGFSLMMENIGLAAMMEVPVVIVDVMRGSPSTGLPTMVGQSDVMQVRWGSHGDIGVVAYSPSSPQECFDLTIRAFNVADEYRLPVFIMMDEVLGHMTERVVIPPVDEIPRVERKRPVGPPGAEKFLPYKPDNDLVPPMAYAGEGYNIHFTGLTHDERGYPTLTADVHDKLVRRLVDKVKKNAADIVLYDEYLLDDAEVIVVAFGCTARSARRAVALARQRGVKAGLLRPITLWPFPEARIRKRLNAGHVKRFVVPEINLGQIRREVERLTQLPVQGINHGGGAMIAPQTILEVILQ
ncbi:MAG: 2-oxoacid:acceptor oxidoreductase subunit alpha [FCB group bacterium]|jgi:2-oxoglutarate ferredoxin oxidoreductase subunit alpha|nr:2-oxoacid:acceptor oxidoreductase subunit alpha [FCB group bacterium]